ncbi:MAG TPA: DUF364 domain-containing protein [Burkholderiales bacterium]|nr:DUF364 domain-containing protein [Burkholderiales bacterium]
MTIVEELLAIARRIADVLGAPEVTAVHIPPWQEDPGRDAEFCAVRLTDGSVGTAYVLLEDTLQRIQQRRGEAPRSALDMAQGFADSDPVDRALGLAAINALSQSLFRRGGFVPDFATNSLGSLDLGPGDHLGMIGFFRPLLERVRARSVPLTVLELQAHLVREEPGFAVTLDPGRLAACNKIVSTSTVLLNDSLDGLLERVRHAEQFVIIGPSAGCVPDPLFERGVSAVGGSLVTDADAFMRRAAASEPWGDAARKYHIARGTGYPGIAALMERARHAEP